MAKNLMIIESPNKIQTIKKFLSGDWEIVATIGHIRDLGKNGPRALGFDEQTLEPTWIIPRLGKNIGSKGVSAKQRIENIKKAGSKATNIYIASDPDREGEAIAWHVYEILNEEDKKKVKRITFNEITKNAVLEAIADPRSINNEWVDSQFTRRILDRLVGFTLSKLISHKLSGARSAGRVQTVALKLIYDREKEIQAFKSYKWWTIETFMQTNDELVLREVNPTLKNIKLFDKKTEDDSASQTKSEVLLQDENSATTIVKSLSKEFEVYAVDKPTYRSRHQPAPLKTSSMQITAINKLGWNISKVTQIAQRLYEGISLHGEHTALISYPRTDSIRYSPVFIAKAKDFIVAKYGKEYYDNYYSKVEEPKKGEKKENVQDAHEAIRVIDPEITPESIKSKISDDDYKLYKLIWIRTLASLMPPSKTEIVTIRLSNNESKFYTHSSKIVFDGYKRIGNELEEKEKASTLNLDNFKVGTILKSKSIKPIEHIAPPPPRYNQATLIAALEKAGVGRPSTYRQMASVAADRGYADIQSKAFVMTKLGDEVIENVGQYFPDIVDINLTKEMEEHLDLISHGHENWKQWVLAFKQKFDKSLEYANANMKNVGPKTVDRKCPLCGSELVQRFSPKTRKTFIGCSNYPTCKYVENADGTVQAPPQKLDELCPTCGKNLLLRSSHSGNKFIGCSGFPKCHYLRPANMTDEQYQTIRKIISEQKAKKNKKPADALPPELKKLYEAANANRYPKKAAKEETPKEE